MIPTFDGDNEGLNVLLGGDRHIFEGIIGWEVMFLIVYIFGIHSGKNVKEILLFEKV